MLTVNNSILLIFIYHNLDTLKLIYVHYTTGCRGLDVLTSFLKEIGVQRSMTKREEG